MKTYFWAPAPRLEEFNIPLWSPFYFQTTSSSQKISIYAHPHGTRELCWFLLLLSVCLKCDGDLQLRVRFPNVTTATEQRLADLSLLTVPCQEMTQPHAAN